MATFINSIIINLTSTEFEGLAIFTILFLVFLAIYRKWLVLLLTLLTIVLGWGAQDVIITNITSYTNNPNQVAMIIDVPLIIYCTGGVMVIILLLISFLKS